MTEEMQELQKDKVWQEFFSEKLCYNWLKHSMSWDNETVVWFAEDQIEVGFITNWKHH